MKKKYFIGLLMLIAHFGYAQVNLVPNPGFEIYNSCFFGGGGITNAIPWFQPFTLGSSTDYFNACSVGQITSVPNNAAGYQIARNGLAYAGFIPFGPPNYREYLEVQLIDSLVQGEEYCISFYVSLAESSTYAINKVGSYLSSLPVYYSASTYAVLPYQPQIENPIGNIITDTVNWVLVQGSFIASGGEKYMTIGNFKNDVFTDTVILDPSFGTNWSYYYIDDVSVVQGSCNVGVNEIKNEGDKVIVYPNPTAGIVIISNDGDANIQVFDASGQEMFKAQNLKSIDLGNYQNGIYCIKIINSNGNIKYNKIVLLK